MKTSATNRKMRILLTSIRNETLIPRPEFQRRLVWTDKHKLEFIKTVLMGYPFPEIYIAAGDVNSETGEGKEMLVDGQQRLTTLYQYFLGSEDLRLRDVRPYSELREQEKLDFLEYEVVVRDLGQRTIEEIREVFTRINSTKYSLNAMEIHNARFDGAFKQFGEQMSEHPFFENHRIFNTRDIKRMGDLLFCLAVIITIMSTYFNRDDELEEYLSRFNDEYPDQDEMSQQLQQTFAFIDACEFDSDCRVWKRADLFTLLIEMHRAIFKNKIKITTSSATSHLYKFYNMVDEIATKGGKDKVAEKYYKASLQATNDRSSRITRGQIIERILEQAANKGRKVRAVKKSK